VQIDTFLFRLAGPMQSWGTQSRFLVRDTGAEPSKSAIVGLLCAALGKPRDERPADHPRLSELAALRLAVRADREGEVRLDYHTTGGSRSSGDEYGVIRADGSPGGTVVSRRYYLTDAEFLVGIEGETTLLETIVSALSAPKWQIFLGRKAFPPSVPIVLPDGPPWDAGWRHGTRLIKAITSYPWLGVLAPLSRVSSPLRLRIVADDSDGSETRRDLPLSFSPCSFSIRHVKTTWVDFPEEHQ
jgi:CRISPR system Cascade subunit CasD